MLARAGTENFPVALRALPAALRRDLLAIYGFARLADTLGDEVEGDRLARLDALEMELDRAFEGRATHPLLQRMQGTLRSGRLSRQPLADLIQANRQDQRVHRYGSWQDLRGYCALSADPVGRLVLEALGESTPEKVAWSDAICTALQLAEHLQDVREDFEAGRVYLPAEDMTRFGVGESMLAASPAPGSLRRLLEFEAARARRLLRLGEPLVGHVRSPGRLAVAGFVAGGHAALDALARAGFDPSGGAPRARRRDVLRHVLALLWRTRRLGGRR